MLLNLAGPVIVMTSQLVMMQLNHYIQYTITSHYHILVMVQSK